LTSNRHTESQHNDVEYITNIEDFLKEHNYFKDKRLVVIGGEQVYNLMMPFAEVLHLTGVRKISTHFDAKAPCIPDHFKLVSRTPLTDYSDYERHERI
jgi:dihydrofolate reductase